MSIEKNSSNNKTNIYSLTSGSVNEEKIGGIWGFFGRMKISIKVNDQALGEGKVWKLNAFFSFFKNLQLGILNRFKSNSSWSKIKIEGTGDIYWVKTKNIGTKFFVDILSNQTPTPLQEKVIPSKTQTTLRKDVIPSIDTLHTEENLDEVIDIFNKLTKVDEKVLKTYQKKFAEMSPQQIERIGKICVEKDRYFAKHMKYLGIKDEKLVIELAKTCVQNHFSNTLNNFREMGINDQEAIVEIFDICLQDHKDDINLITKFKNFGISNPVIILKKLEPLLKQNPQIKGYDYSAILDNIDFQNLDGEKKLAYVKLLRLCHLEKKSEDFDNILIEHYTSLNGEEIDSLSEFFSLKYNLEVTDNEEYFKNSYSILEEYANKHFVDLKYDSFLEKIKDIPDPFKRWQTLVWLAQTFLILRATLLPEQLKFIKENQILDSCINIASVPVRLISTFGIIAASLDESFQKKYKSINVPKAIEAKNGTLLRALLAHKIREEDIPLINAFTNKLTKDFKDQKKYLSVVMLLVMMDLKNQDYKIFFKKLNEIKDGKTLISEIKSLKSLLELDQEVDFENAIKNEITFSDLFKDEFKNLVPIKDIENFSQKMNSTFESSRNPTAIYVFAAKMKKHTHVERHLVGFVTSVLENTFYEKRNSFENNKHLETIFKNDSVRREKWRKPLKEFVVESNSKKGGLTAVDTEDPYDLLLCGYEVPSCMDYSKDSSDLNPGLLAYIMDGKIRMIAIKDQSGRIVSRSMIKILFDGEKPVLLLEKGYPTDLPPNHKNAIREMAKRKAQALGIPLVESGGQGESYPREIKALGGPANEYSDASNSFNRLQPKGEYTILHSNIIWEPQAN